MMTRPDQRISFGNRQQAVAAAGIWRRIHRRHKIMGGVALVLSAGLHVALLTSFKGFTVYGLMRDRLPDMGHQAPLKLKDVRVQPEIPANDRRPPRFRPEQARGAAAGEVGDEAARFRRETDRAAVEPRVVGQGALVGEDRGLESPAPVDRPVWEPRQEVMGINRRIVKEDDAAGLPRRYLPLTPRQQGGADIVMPVDRADVVGGGLVTGAYASAEDPSQFTWGRGGPVGFGGSGRGGASASPPPKALLDEPKRLLDDDARRASILKALERYLKADVFVYSPLGEAPYDYCRIEIKRRSEALLPVLAKDVVLVQDASASISEKKLRYCRDGLVKALETLGAEDRFNVVEFRDSAIRCFEDWAPVDPAHLRRAREFVGRMVATGNTDIFGSLDDLLSLPRKPGRPVILMVVSDGVATVGLRDRSLIIEAFSEANRGAVSVFTVGTYPGVNAYLLDLLSYRNRGDTEIVRTGRWDIPEVIWRRLNEVSRPVLSDVRFRFAGQTWCEAYPLLTCNLYLDRPLVLHGRIPKGTRNLVFQATGRADDIQCDMVFDLDLNKAGDGGKEIATAWAWQKVYALIGEHNRTKQPGIINQLREVGKEFQLKIPYRNELKD
jgi:hypothetical protein